MPRSTTRSSPACTACPAGTYCRSGPAATRVRRYWTRAGRGCRRRSPDVGSSCASCSPTRCGCGCAADVPVGTSLSGGVDSSAVVGLAGSLAEDADRHAFTALRRLRPRRVAEYAALVPSRGRHRAPRGRPTADGVLADLDALVDAQEEPFGSLSIYAQWRVKPAAHRPPVTVLLDGQGGDELFGGYAGTSRLGAARAGGARVLKGLRPGPAAHRSARRARRRALPDRSPAGTAGAWPRRTWGRSPSTARSASNPVPAARAADAAAPRAAAPVLPHEPAAAAALRGPRLDGAQPRGPPALPGPPGRRVRPLAPARSSSTADGVRRRSCATRSATSVPAARSWPGETRSASSRRRRAGWPSRRRSARIREVLLDPCPRRQLYDRGL